MTARGVAINLSACSIRWSGFRVVTRLQLFLGHVIDNRESIFSRIAQRFCYSDERVQGHVSADLIGAASFQNDGYTQCVLTLGVRGGFAENAPNTRRPFQRGGSG